MNNNIIFLTMISRITLLILFCQTLIGTYFVFEEKFRVNSFLLGQKTITNNNNSVNSIVSISHSKHTPKCYKNTYEKWMNYVCPVDSFINDLDIDDMSSAILQSIETLWVTSVPNAKGPLTTFPSNVCRFTNLKVYKKKNNE